MSVWYLSQARLSVPGGHFIGLVAALLLLQLLRGFTDGLYAGDPAIKRLPCALQANEPVWDGSYIGTRLPQVRGVCMPLSAFLSLQSYDRGDVKCF
jgi:hypothetical protein